MRVLIIGDVMARPGRVAVLERIQDLREQHAVDLAVMNAENLAGGFSVTESMAEELFASGIDVMTSGNHIFDKREAGGYIARQPRLLRPANYPEASPGSGVWVGEVRGHRAAVINLMGRVYMPPTHDNPFTAADTLLSRLGEDVKVRVVDMHAEATSEKVAMGWHLDGRVSAVVGTHTHVQTADERVLPRGTAYITDIGMTGSHAGCIGMEREGTIERFLNPAAPRAEHSKGDVRIHAVVIDVDDSTGRAREISRLSLPHES
ncbi:MAG TPA: TIGR00282 family metallophosphoesterase [Pyrinomonadaceae bacterium]|jgi:metallophosphoesterase (TIGR00282 family)|nr:TIGR00282 family metallophosphoesterase [Pyrinomonadaceae bacterium]